MKFAQMAKVLFYDCLISGVLSTTVSFNLLSLPFLLTDFFFIIVILDSCFFTDSHCTFFSSVMQFFSD